MTLPEIQQQGREEYSKFAGVKFLEENGWDTKSSKDWLDTYSATVWDAALAAVEEKIKDFKLPYPNTDDKRQWNDEMDEIIEAVASLKSPEAALELVGEE